MEPQSMLEVRFQNTISGPRVQLPKIPSLPIGLVHYLRYVPIRVLPPILLINKDCFTRIPVMMHATRLRSRGILQLRR
jgi:hypothetical protein